MQAWLARRHNDVSDAVVGETPSPTITAIAENVPRGAVWLQHVDSQNGFFVSCQYSSSL